MAEFVEVMKTKSRMCEFMGSSGECATRCKLSCNVNEKKMFCYEFTRNYPIEAEKIVMDWAKEHPVITNADKFKEVFNSESAPEGCSYMLSESCTATCDSCKVHNFWEQEYKEPKGE